MKDERGLYYFPNAADRRARMYVRRGEDGGVQFRLWQSDHPEVWDRHQWLDLQVIEDAAHLYREERNADADPLKLYDAAVARALLEVNPEYRAALKAAGYLTRDPRMKERKKYGLKAARRAPQFSKR